jgi:hypothetical protein
MKSTTPLFFPKIPSFLEIKILDTAGWCDICRIYNKHKTFECCFCKRNLCLKKGDLWNFGYQNVDTFICKYCRVKVQKNERYFIFIKFN